MIVWSGFGILAALFALLGIVAGVALVDGTGGVGIGLSENAGLALGLVLAAVVNWLVGAWLNHRPGRELIDAKTGERIILRRRHRLFWVPMQYWSVVMVVFAALAVIASHTPPPQPAPAATPQAG